MDIRWVVKVHLYMLEIIIIVAELLSVPFVSGFVFQYRALFGFGLG